MNFVKILNERLDANLMRVLCNETASSHFGMTESAVMADEDTARRLRNLILDDGAIASANTEVIAQLDGVIQTLSPRRRIEVIILLATHYPNLVVHEYMPASSQAMDYIIRGVDISLILERARLDRLINALRKVADE